MGYMFSGNEARQVTVRYLARIVSRLGLPKEKRGNR